MSVRAVCALFLRTKPNTGAMHLLGSWSFGMDIVWIAALALFWVALVVGVDGLVRLVRQKKGGHS
jgi:hypothetical protein